MAIDPVTAKVAADAALKAVKDPKKTATVILWISLASMLILMIPVICINQAGSFINSFFESENSGASSRAELDDTFAGIIFQGYLNEYDRRLADILNNNIPSVSAANPGRSVAVRHNTISIDYIYAYAYCVPDITQEDVNTFLENVVSIEVVTEGEGLVIENKIATPSEINEIYPDINYQEAFQTVTGLSSTGFDITYPEDGMQIPLYYQYDPAWANIRYGDGCIWDSGCGPTCIAMVLSYEMEYEITPADVVLFTGNRYWSRAGSSWSIFPACASNWNIGCNKLGKNINSVISELAAGNPVIASMKPGRFTNSGHFIVLRGLTEDGKILVNDPYDTEDKKFCYQAFSPEDIAAESKNFWSFYK